MSAGLFHPAPLPERSAANVRRIAQAAPQRPWQPSQHRCPARRRRCQAAAQRDDVGRLLRDALQQPAQGQNLAYLAAGNFLQGLGIDNQTEINRVLDVAMNPNSLWARNNRKQPTNPHARPLSVDDDLKPLVEFLQAAGLSQEQIAKAILVHPALLSYRVEQRLQPFFAFLAEQPLALSRDEAAVVVQRRPSILGVEVAGLRRMVAFLLESGNSREQVIELMATTL
ncbi:hypothetical protein D9Q98_002276 [Chlorella vulgaris]|uniref:Uncharacterized protein n=1 Tax=Chlorella vulgaris TaxID=3077 RepID=A0A9D4TXA4_CHLVU|nr:hypothetical protein D9Q98_002276 [Chlorella vulgaris]